MTEDEMTALVKAYFSAVDNKTIEGILATLTEDCRFTVESHGVELNGHDEIRAMFTKLWTKHKAVLHDQFVFAPAPAHNRVAVQFQVTNTLHDDSLRHKSNANFFTVRGDRFDTVAVYMSGENTLVKG
ncbi:MAG: nuclear transport factor 2 family protein [Rhodospirillaceae bacterium]|mgnify:CR=1 FL=1|nr:nuclear transport factor 2 family protein [Rhodospirillaceae bacterium]